MAKVLTDKEHRMLTSAIARINNNIEQAKIEFERIQLMIKNTTKVGAEVKAARSSSNAASSQSYEEGRLKHKLKTLNKLNQKSC